MAAMNFPSSPSNGDTYTNPDTGVTYTYDGTDAKWKTTVTSNAFLPLSGGTLTGALNVTDIKHPSSGSNNIVLDSSGNVNLDAGTLYVDASNNRVGVGTTSPAQLFHTSRATDGVHALFYTEDGARNSRLAIYTDSSGSHIQHTYSTAAQSLIFDVGGAVGSGTERARIDGSGRLLVGTSTSTNNTRYEQNFSFVKTGDSTYGGGSFVGYSGTSAEYAPLVDFKRSRGTTDGSMTVVASGDRLGGIAFLGSDGDEFVEGANIRCYVDGTPGNNDMPGRIVLSTTADGAASPTERMRINRTGELAMMCDVNNYNLFISNASTAGTSNRLIDGRYGSQTAYSGTTSFIVYTNGNVQNTNNSYGQISDAKLKENIVDASSQWNDLKAVRVRNFNFKEGQTHRQIGVIAQELELISPGLVYETPDRDEDGNDTGEVTKGVNYSVLYMKAVKALQEAMERIETLEAKVAALEAS